MNNKNCSEVNVHSQELEKLFQLWALKCGTCWMFPENCFNNRLKRIEAVQSHRYAAEVYKNKRVCSRCVRTTLTTNLMCLFDRTEDKINILT